MLSKCQTDWIQIRPDVLSGLIWVQTVCIIYQQTTLGDKMLRKNMLQRHSISLFKVGHPEEAE